MGTGGSVPTGRFRAGSTVCAAGMPDHEAESRSEFDDISPDGGSNPSTCASDRTYWNRRPPKNRVPGGLTTAAAAAVQAGRTRAAEHLRSAHRQFRQRRTGGRAARVPTPVPCSSRERPGRYRKSSTTRPRTATWRPGSHGAGRQGHWARTLPRLATASGPRGRAADGVADRPGRLRRGGAGTAGASAG